MSDETVVEADGITVSKFFNADDFPVPAVAFDVTSSRDQAVTLRIVDEVPDEFGIDQIGFHPEYGSEYWTASGDGVVRFEREVEPEESFTTVYGVRMEDGQDETPFLSAPRVEVEGEDEDIDEVVPQESTDVVRELAGGERDTVPGLEDEAELAAEVEASDGDDLDSLADDAEILGDEADPDSEPAIESETDLESEPQTAVAGDGADETPGGEPGVGAESEESADAPEEAEAEPEISGEPGIASEDDESVTDASDFGDSPDLGDEPVEVDTEPDPAAVGFDASDVVGALAEAIREDEVSEEDLQTLQSAFGGVPNSTQVEIEHLQSRVSELEAYTDALEEFIDEEGTAQELVSDIESDVHALRDELDDVESTVESAASDREEIRETIEEVEDGFDAVDELENDVERLQGDLEALDERVADTEELAFDVDDLEDDLEDLEDHVDEIEEWRSQLSDVFGT